MTHTGSIPTNIISQAKQGIYEITGTANSDVQIEIDSNTTLSNSSGNTMTATLLADRKAVRLNADGRETLNVGGTLSVMPKQPAGDYEGTYTIHMSY